MLVKITPKNKVKTHQFVCKNIGCKGYWDKDQIEEKVLGGLNCFFSGSTIEILGGKVVSLKQNGVEYTMQDGKLLKGGSRGK